MTAARKRSKEETQEDGTTETPKAPGASEVVARDSGAPEDSTSGGKPWEVIDSAIAREATGEKVDWPTVQRCLRLIGMTEEAYRSQVRLRSMDQEMLHKATLCDRLAQDARVKKEIADESLENYRRQTDAVRQNLEEAEKARVAAALGLKASEVSSARDEHEKAQRVVSAAKGELRTIRAAAEEAIAAWQDRIAAAEQTVQRAIGRMRDADRVRHECEDARRRMEAAATVATP